MSTPMVRGYCVLRALSFVDQHFGSQHGAQIRGRLSDGFRSATSSLKPNEWVPRECHVELLRTIAETHNDDDTCHDDLVRCGESMAVEAHDTFLRLAMQVMTPKLFAKKMPTMWNLTHYGSGTIDVDLDRADDGVARIRLVDVGGYDHLGATYLGWIKRGFARVGRPDAFVEQVGWSRATPGPDTITYEIAWS